VPFFKGKHDGKQFFVSDAVVELSEKHFFKNKCNWMEDRFVIFDMLLRKDTRGDIVKSIGLDNGFEVEIEVLEDCSSSE